MRYRLLLLPREYFENSSWRDGHAVAAVCAEGQEGRQRCDKHPQREEPLLAPLARPREPLPGAVHQLLGIRHDRR